MQKRESRDSSPDVQDKNKWVKKLQQESWELELLVSGFSILLLSMLTKKLQLVLDNITFNLNTEDLIAAAVLFIIMFVLLASYALIINMIIHLIFRGFWVGIVGLGSVAPKTEFSRLKYSSFFTKKLKKRLTKLDDLVLLVDKISSLIFAFAFLIIFFIISIGLFFVSLIVLSLFASKLIELFGGSAFENILSVFFDITIVLFLISGLIYVIDFLTLGFFKKYKWLSKIYYPIYYLFGWITLSFLYRTIYYNLISRFTKRKTGMILIPYLLIIILIPLTSFNHHIYYPEKSTNSHINNNYYSDLRDKEDHINKIDIPSYIIKDGLLPIFISYSPKDNLTVKKLFPDFTPEINEGFNSKLKFTKTDENISLTSKSIEENQEKPLECLSGLYRIYLNDSLYQNPVYYFKKDVNREEKGIFTVIDIHDLPRGQHVLLVKKVKFDKKEQIWENYAFAPFWKE